MPFAPTFVAVSFLLSALQSSLPAIQQQSIAGTEPLVSVADASILTYSSPLPDSINMHIARAPEGLILFDTLRRADQVEDAMTVIEQLGEPVAIVITHAHTDHYGGASFFRQRFPEVPIYASEAIVTEMRDDVVPDNKARRALFGERFPTQAMIDANLPDHIVADGEPVMIAGLEIVPHLMGASESAAAVVYDIPSLGAVVTGDLVNVLTIAAPTLSLATWLTQLDQLDAIADDTDTLYVGHGPGGPKSLIEDQRIYLQRLDALVREAASDRAGVSQEETDAIVGKVRFAYPHHKGAAFMPPDALIRESVGWVAQQLVDEKG